jgi:dipeptidyl aminopeptidase/acylaminoacyl peptidase
LIKAIAQVGPTKSRPSRWRWLLLMAPLLLAAAAGWGTLRAAGQALFPARTRVTQAQTDEARQFLPRMEDVSFRTRDGLVLRGWFAPGENRSAIVFVHGLWSNRGAFLGEAEALARDGQGVLLYDSRASGASDGHMATFGDRERLDIEAALDYLGTRPDVDSGRIGLFGCSVGGTAVALVGAEDPRVRAVVLGPTWLTLDAEIRAKFRWPRSGLLLAAYRLAGVDVDALRPVDVVRSINPRPLFLLSGANDTDTPPSIMKSLQDAAPGAERWVVPGAGHCRYIDASPVEYLQRLDGFFARALAGPGNRGSRP